MILDIDILVLGNLIEVQVFAEDGVRIIVGSVIDEHCEVVRVILAEDRVEGQLYPEVDVVIEGAGNEANGELLFIGLELVELTHSIVLLLLFVGLLVL